MVLNSTVLISTPPSYDHDEEIDFSQCKAVSLCALIRSIYSDLASQSARPIWCFGDAGIIHIGISYVNGPPISVSKGSTYPSDSNYKYPTVPSVESPSLDSLYYSGSHKQSCEVRINGSSNLTFISDSGSESTLTCNDVIVLFSSSISSECRITVYREK